MAKSIPFIVLVQSPQYGTLSWGPFPTRAKATSFMHGKLHEHLYATYESISFPGLVIWEQPLYDPAFDEKEDSDG